MPFITIEIDTAIVFAQQPFVVEMHHYLAHALDVPIQKMKTKLDRLPEAFVGVGESLYARLTVELRVGRNLQLLQDVGSELYARFSRELALANPNVPMRVTVTFYQIEANLLFVHDDSSKAKRVSS